LAGERKHLSALTSGGVKKWKTLGGHFGKYFDIGEAGIRCHKKIKNKKVD